MIDEDTWLRRHAWLCFEPRPDGDPDPDYRRLHQHLCQFGAYAYILVQTSYGTFPFLLQAVPGSWRMIAGEVPDLRGDPCEHCPGWGRVQAGCGMRSAGARLGTTGPMALLGFARSGGGERITLSQSSSWHATSVTGADWPHVVAWAGLPAGICATPPGHAGLSGTSTPPLSRSPSPGPTTATTIFSSLALYYCACALTLRSLPFTHPVYVASRYFQ